MSGTPADPSSSTPPEHVPQTDEAVITTRPGGFNLLPYRHMRSRRASHRLRLRVGCALVSGLAVSGALAAWQARGATRLQADYAVLERAWTRLAPALAGEARGHAQLARARASDARRTAAAARRARFARLLALLERHARDSVVLVELHHRPRGATLQGRAATHGALQAWLGELERAALVERVALIELGSDAPSSRAPLGIAFAVRIDYALGGLAAPAVAATF